MAIPVIVVGDWIKVRQVAKNTAQYGMNVLKYQCTSAAGAPVTIADVAKYFDTNVAASFAPLLCSNALYWGYGATKVKPVLAPLPEFECHAGRGAGGGGAFILPTQSAPLVSLRTAFGGRHSRGRMYLPFADTTALDVSGALTAAFKVLINALIAALGMPGGIVVPNAGGTGTVTLIPNVTDRLIGSAFVIVATIIRNFTGTQRRRAEINRADIDPFAGSINVP